MVVNGACKHKDMKHFEAGLGSLGLDVRMEYLGQQQLVALQGKGAVSVLQRLAPSLDYKKMNFMTTATATVAGASVGPCLWLGVHVYLCVIDWAFYTQYYSCHGTYI
jgi:glycine cleavage system aminomethyltransferase T